MRKNILTQFALSALLLTAAPFAHAQATLHGIGDLPGGATVSQVRDVTRVDGILVAVGGSSANAGAQGMDTPVVWTSTGGLVAIPNLAVSPATTPAFASAITPDGAYIASRTRIAPTGGVRVAARVARNGFATDNLGFLPGFNFSAATAISDDGSVLYGFGIHDLANHNRAIRFTFENSAWVATAIPFLAEGDDVSVPAGRGASADGSIMVGTSVNSSIAGNSGTAPGNKAFRYVHGSGVSAIPMLPGGTWNGAIGLTRDGNTALVVGDSTSAPQAEAYLYNFAAGQAIRLGTPNGSRIPNNLGGVSDDGIVVLTWFSEGTPFPGVRNQHGWHDLADLAERAGIDLAGWDLDSVVGISADSTLVWGSGIHNGVDEGWVIEFPAGYLANVTNPPLADSPNSPIVGTWTLGDVSAPGGTVLVFFEEGYYLHLQVATEDEMPAGVTGFERGLFRWDQTTGAIQFKTLLDNNGDIGLSDSFDRTGATVTVSGNTLTFRAPGEEPIQLIRAGGLGTSPILGAFGAVNAGSHGNVFIFLPNGIYFHASYAQDILIGSGDPVPPDGIERGTYTWDATNGAFAAATVVDTNGRAGLSGLSGPTTITFPGDGRILYENGSPTGLRRAAPQAVLYGIGDLPGSATYSEVRDVTKFEGRIIAVGGGTAKAGATSSDTQVIWTPSVGLMAIPNLVTNTTGINPLFASAITPDAAWVAGRSRPNPTGGARHAVRINTDTLASEDLGTLPGFPAFSTATSISADGSILYGFGIHDLANHNRAIRYAYDGSAWVATPLPFLAEGDDVSVPAGRGASADGSIMVGTSVNSSIAGNSGTAPGNKAFRYVHGSGVSAIPMLPGGTWNGAIGLSRDGNVAVVVGDSTTAPQSEAYLYNFSTQQAVRLGTPNGSRIPNNLGSVSNNGVVALSWYIEDASPLPTIHNQHGWHDLNDLAVRAGADLTGWSLNNITGMSADATLVWGMGSHNDVNEGWVLEFPAGFLSNAAEPVPPSVVTPLVGAWTLGDTTKDGATVLIFFPDGAYMHLQVPEQDELPHGVPGFERGTYTWNQANGAITFKTLLDTNGDIGLSDSSGMSGFTATVSGNTLTVTTPPEGDNPNGEVHHLSRVVPTRPIEGVFGNGSTANASIAAVFLPNGVYFIAEDGDSDPNSGGDLNGHDGLERGTYTWNATTGVFTATPNVDTNGEWGLSHPDNEVTIITFPGDQNTLYFDGEAAVTRVPPLSEPFGPEQPEGPDVPTRPAFFDAAGYLANNADVAATIGDAGDKLDQAWRHYYLYGVSEGRTDGEFSVHAYLARYPDLAGQFGANLSAAAMHWYTTGRADGLRIPAGFSVTGYFARNQDIAAYFANDKYGAWLHYYNYGVYEGRSFDANFMAAEYLELNHDLKAAIGAGNLKEAVTHWLTWGHPMEDRMGRVPIGFNVDNYLARYPDLNAAFGGITPIAVRNVEVWQHFINYGAAEGRSDGDFDIYSYLASNPDVAMAVNNDPRSAALHWFFYGRREGRRIPAGFDVHNYRLLYPDLIVFGGDDLYGSWLHYRDVGIYEGRIYNDTFRADEYLILNPDIAAVIGNNYRDALLHWLYYGQYEGRQARL